MKPSLQAPSRMAVTALRGLALGTSCSLLLVAEDRRRRIKAVEAIVDNARLIRGKATYAPVTEAELKFILGKHLNKRDLDALAACVDNARLIRRYAPGSEGELKDMLGTNLNKSDAEEAPVEPTVSPTEPTVPPIESPVPPASVAPCPQRKWTLPLLPMQSAEPQKSKKKMNIRPARKDEGKYEGPKAPLVKVGRREGKQALDSIMSTCSAPAVATESDVRQKEDTCSARADVTESHSMQEITGRARADTSEADVRQEITDLERQMQAVLSLGTMSQAFVAKAHSILLKLEKRRDLVLATRVLDIVCQVPEFTMDNLLGLDSIWTLKALLTSISGNCLYDLKKRRPSRRFPIAVCWHRHHRTSIRTSLETTEAQKEQGKRELEVVLAQCFSHPCAEFDIQSFVATYHLRFGREMCSQKVVSRVALLYRKQGKGSKEILDRFLKVAEKGGVPLESSEFGHRLWREWKLEDSGAANTSTRGGEARVVTQLRSYLRSRLPAMKPNMTGSEKDVFFMLEALSSSQDWKSVLNYYWKAVASDIIFSDACLRLAVEAAVELQGIHGEEALNLIQQAHSRGLDTSIILQFLILCRFDAIRDERQRSLTDGTDGHGAFEMMQHLLREVRPFYEKPSVTVYNRAVRTCIWSNEFQHARNLCLEVTNVYLGGDPLYTVHNFTNLLVISALAKDYPLLVGLLQVLSRLHYKLHDMCARALWKSRWHIIHHIDTARSARDRAVHQRAYDFVNWHYQNIVDARIRDAVYLQNSMYKEAKKALSTPVSRPWHGNSKRRLRLGRPQSQSGKQTSLQPA